MEAPSHSGGLRGPASLRVRVLAVVLPLAACVAQGCAGAGAPDAIHRDRTHVLWITICTLRADHLGAYGYELDVSPNLDALAAEGVVFERVLTPAPWTRPAMAGMITGVHPRSLAIEDRARWPNDRALASAVTTLAERLHEAGYFTIGITANPNTNAVFGFDQGYDVYEDTGRLWRSGYASEKLTAETVVGRLVETLRGPAKGRRFFAHLVLVDAHRPYRTQTALEKVDPLPPGGASSAYDLQIRYVDAVLGELRETLHAMDLRDTLWVVTSDHGEGMGRHGADDRAHGRSLYNSTLWVPLILQHPALPAHRVATRVEMLDALPTVLDLLGIPSGSTPLHGRSLVPALDGELTPRETFVVETAFEGMDKSAVLRDGWKLIVDHRAQPEAHELYRYRKDPQEQDDRAVSEPATVDVLRQALNDWRERVDAVVIAPPEAQPATLDPGERRALEALGYVESPAAAEGGD